MQALVKLFQALGGKIHYNSEVAEIVTDQGRVTGIRTHDGARESFDVSG